jgi:protein SCO1/2
MSVQQHSREWVKGQIATGRRFVPNVPVTTHEGDEKLFYDDLVRDRTVLVQFMSLAHHQQYPVTTNLVQVQRQLGLRLGRDVFMYSITVDPMNDTVEKLREFARRKSAGPGWTFLTGDEAAIEALKKVFFVHAGHETHAHGHGNAGSGTSPDCSLGLMRYGNDAAGIWGSVPTKSDPALIVERLSWIQPVQPRGQRRLRRGRTIQV